MKVLEVFKNVWKIEELRNKIILTMLLLVVYRLGSYIPLVGIDTSKLGALEEQTSSGILGLLNSFTGGAFAKASILAIGIMPYISASIIVQIMGVAIPYLQKLQKDGESGRRKKERITRWLTIGVALVQSPGYIANIRHQLPNDAIMLPDSIFWSLSLITLLAGTIFTMWLGERITDKGIGNGISFIIMIGIIARFPASFLQELDSKINGGGGLIIILLEIIIWMIVIGFSLILIEAVRKVTIHYAGGNSGRIGSISRQYIPLKLNSSGVMPIIFAQAMMFVPISFIGMATSMESNSSLVRIFTDINGIWYNVIFSILIVLFSYFYTAIAIPSRDIANGLKRDGGFIPGIRPGEETVNYIDEIMSRITFPGSVFLCIIAVLPSIVHRFGVGQQFALFFGGTSLLILVGVALDSLQQVNSYLLNHHYDGLMAKDKSSDNMRGISI